MRQKVPNWPKLGASYFPKKKFLGNVEQHCFVLTMHHAMSFQESCHRADHENKVAQFLPELTLVQKGNFVEKLTNMTNV